jgi:uncharacterized protein (DUF433 family)
VAPALTLTLSEASFVLERSLSVLNKAVDTGVIRARRRTAGKRVQRLLGAAELRFLQLANELDRNLTPTGQRRLYQALRNLSAEAHRVKLGSMELDLVRVDRELKARLSRLDSVRKQIDRKKGQPDAVIRGTSVPAHLIAALARTQTVDEILEDFPSLRRGQVEAAIEYARAYPKRGRPYAGRSLKRTLSDMADLGVFEDTASDEASPRTIP